MFSSLGTLFCQFAAGYLGRSADRRGRHVEGQPLWSLMQMQDLLDEWLISVWQNRAHDGLRDPLHPQRTFSPNQKYAALIEAAGYVPVPLSAEDHIELLPAVWRAVNAYGIKISHRTYDAPELNPIRQQRSGVAARKGLWEVRHDPYDVSRVFVRGPGGWITCPWKYLEKVLAPFGELAWDHVSGRLAAQGQPGPSELERAQAVDDLLRRAYHGPPDDPGTEAASTGRPQRRPLARDRRVAARTRAATAARAGAGTPADPVPPRTGDTPETPQQDSGEPVAKGDPPGNLQRPRRSEETLVSEPAASAAPAGGTEDEALHRQLTVLAGWRRFVDDEPVPPELLPDRRWRRLSDAGRLAYDEARLNHHSRLLVVATPVIRKVITEGRRLSYLNRNADSGRCGLILSGPARTGKTTAITQLGKTLEAVHRQRHPRSGGDIPVIYITVPPAATAKMIAIEFARFLGLPVIRRANLTDIIEAVCGVCTDTRAGLVAVEIHNVNLATRAGAEASDMLKYFSERIPATFVYAGIDVERAGLLSGTRGEQIAGRFGMVRTSAFPRGDSWTGLISALEDSLRLHRHQPGALTGLEEYLHRRTGGMIGSLLRLIRGAAIQAVLDGTEKITRATLDSIGVDIASETADAGRRRPRSGP